MSNIYYYFDDCGYANDFECLVDVNEYLDCIPEETYDLWLKAYDTSCCDNAHEKNLYEQGYAFECHARIKRCYNGKQIEMNIEPQAAKTMEEAECILIKMAEDTMNRSDIVYTLKALLEDDTPNANIHDIKNKIKSRIDSEKYFIDLYDRKRSAIINELCSSNIKNKVAVYEHEKLIRKSSAYAQHINDIANVVYGLQQAYDIVCEALGEDS